MDRLHDPALHVEDAGTGGLPSATPNGRARQRADREHGVVVPEHQHARLAAARPVHVRPVGTVDDRWPGCRCDRGSPAPPRRPTSTSASTSCDGDSTLTSRSRSCNIASRSATCHAHGTAARLRRWKAHLARPRRLVLDWMGWTIAPSSPSSCGRAAMRSRPSRSGCRAARGIAARPGCAAKRWRCSPACRSPGTRGSSRGAGSTPRPTCCRRSGARCGSTMPGIEHLHALAQPSPLAGRRAAGGTERTGAPDRVDGAGPGVRARPALGVPRLERRRGPAVPAHRRAGRDRTQPAVGAVLRSLHARADRRLGHPRPPGAGRVPRGDDRRTAPTPSSSS